MNGSADETGLNSEAPVLFRLGAWANERFPLANAVLFLVLYLSALALGRMWVTDGEISVGARDILGFFAVWAFFLVLRIFDEHKDYELDCHNHPERVLQSGRITLGHLKVLGAMAIGLQAGISFYLDGGWGLIPLFWLIALGWSLLMAAEFFCGEWLEKRLLLYAISHMVVMPLALLWMAQIGAMKQTLPAEVGLLAALAFLAGASLEVTRKLKAPGDERETIDSYTKVFGTTRAPVVVICLLIATMATSALILRSVFSQQMPLYWGGLLLATMVPAVWALQQFRKSPSARTAKTSEGMVGLAMLTTYVLVLSATLVERGLVWS